MGFAIQTSNVRMGGRSRSFLRKSYQSWTEIQPSEALRDTAERLLALHPLRAADALQLASAILWCQGITVEQSFVAFDRRLRDASYREGFTVLPDMDL